MRVNAPKTLRSGGGEGARFDGDLCTVELFRARTRPPSIVGRDISILACWSRAWIFADNLSPCRDGVRVNGIEREGGGEGDAPFRGAYETCVNPWGAGQVHGKHRGVDSAAFYKE